MGQGHHRHGRNGGGCYTTGPESGEQSGHQGCQPGGLDTRKPDPDRWTREAAEGPTVAARKAAQINANAKTKPNPKAKPSTCSETRTDTDTENHTGGERGDIISTDTNQTMGDDPTTNLKDGGQPSPSPYGRLVHGRQTPDPKQRQQCATPQ